MKVRFKINSSNIVYNQLRRVEMFSGAMSLPVSWVHMCYSFKVKVRNLGR